MSFFLPKWLIQRKQSTSYHWRWKNSNTVWTLWTNLYCTMLIEESRRSKWYVESRKDQNDPEFANATFRHGEFRLLQDSHFEESWRILKDSANTSIWWNRLLRWIKLSIFENGILWKSESHLKIMRIEELQIAVNIDTAKEVWKWQWKYKPRIMPTNGIRLFSNRWICNAFRSYLLIENEYENSGMTSTKR